MSFIDQKFFLARAKETPQIGKKIGEQIRRQTQDRYKTDTRQTQDRYKTDTR
jgi:hypothetical protein